ncbi:MAG: protein-L-isoaspartate(D-aspartate) O-methyltransferase [Gammaproteobacteria bacterium]|nr:MAG: protein-L-isoaspartate(D-aspartate) O-methyltransferase [Gammaproteobacteria bacterium]TND06473.1 MAG: protein-L-isoaspartate(D-aspartate) O-methyltransferase [Gammaproteobacteria bacterium]
MEITFENKRKRMVDEIREEVTYTRHMIHRDTLSQRVIDAMMAVPRHEFVPPDMQTYAYANEPLPIGNGQTISQPYIVAIMTELLEPESHHIVLEAGTGSGYQAAVLSQLVKTVYTVETIAALGEEAARRLQKLGYDNVVIRTGDAWFGWPEHAPYDSIIVTAAAPMIPPPLIDQLKRGGRMVVPLGSRFGQDLVLLRKDMDGKITTEVLLPVAFVPLTGDHLTPRTPDDSPR